MARPNGPCLISTPAARTSTSPNRARDDARALRGSASNRTWTMPTSSHPHGDGRSAPPNWRACIDETNELFTEWDYGDYEGADPQTDPGRRRAGLDDLDARRSRRESVAAMTARVDQSGPPRRRPAGCAGRRDRLARPLLPSVRLSLPGLAHRPGRKHRSQARGNGAAVGDRFRSAAVRTAGPARPTTVVDVDLSARPFPRFAASIPLHRSAKRDRDEARDGRSAHDRPPLHSRP